MDELIGRLVGREVYGGREKMATEQLRNAVPYQPPTILDNLINRRVVLLEELNRIEAAIKIFETEPRVADALETITKALR